jgi:hypothetical protein
MKTTQIVIISEGRAFRIKEPARLKIFHEDRAQDVDFDIVCVDGEMYLARDVLKLARTGRMGFRRVGSQSAPEEWCSSQDRISQDVGAKKSLRTDA